MQTRKAIISAQWKGRLLRERLSPPQPEPRTQLYRPGPQGASSCELDSAINPGPGNIPLDKRQPRHRGPETQKRHPCRGLAQARLVPRVSRETQPNLPTRRAGALGPEKADRLPGHCRLELLSVCAKLSHRLQSQAHGGSGRHELAPELIVSSDSDQ